MAGGSGGPGGGGRSGGAGGKGGPGDVIAGGIAQATHPRGMLDAVGFIELAYADEKGGAIIDPSRLTTPVRLEFMEVGFRGSFVSGLVTALLSPLAIAVLDERIPIFGTMNPTMFDKFCGLLLALVFSFGYALFLSNVATRHLGGYSRAMINNLLGGVTAAGVIKALVVFIGFHVIYFKLLTDQNVAGFLKRLMSFKLPYDSAISIFNWVRETKGILITSAWFVVVTTAIFIAIPYIAMLWAHFRNKKRIEAGVYDVWRDDE